jgi:8-oxo-dGTP diphosphatase
VTGKILITRRALTAHQGGLWEFPGGKLERGETVFAALCRELQEEVGIAVQQARPLIKINHDYGDKQVLLDVWEVLVWSGEADACEGQAMAWVAASQLTEYAFPAANLSIIKAVQLPEFYAILEGRSTEEVLSNCQKILHNGVSLLQIRLKSLPVSEVSQCVALVLQLCRQYRVEVLFNSDLPGQLDAVQGLHLSSLALAATTVRPEGLRWLAASCHNLDELQQAQRLGVDFAVLAPVQNTTTHPDVVPLGWEPVESLLQQVNFPVYLMGGLAVADSSKARLAGAQGIAGISAFLG